MLRSSIMVSLLSAATSLVSCANQVLIANYFGASASLDAYWIAISLPMFFIGLVACLFSYSIVPALVRHRICDSRDSEEFSSGLFLVFFCISVMVSSLFFYFAPAMVRVLAPKAPAAVLAEAGTIARVAWIGVGMGVVGNCLMAVENAKRCFFLPALANILPYLGMMLSCVCFGRLGVVSLAWGLLVGYLLAIILIWSKSRSRFLIRFPRKKILDDVGRVMAGWHIVAVSMLCFTAFGTVDTIWASRLGEGNVSFLSYSQRIVIAVGNLVVMGPWTVLTPFLAEQASGRRWAEFQTTMSQAVRMTILLSSLAALVVSLLSTPIIELLFERGSFDAQAVRTVASVLPTMLCGMVAMSSVALFMKAFHAAGRVGEAAMIGGGGMLLYFVLSGILSAFMGLYGMALAYAVCWWVLFGVSASRISAGSVSSPSFTGTLQYGIRVLVALVAVAPFILCCRQLLIEPMRHKNMVALSVSIVLTAGVSLFLFLGISGFFFAMSEVKLLARLLRWTKPAA